MIFDTAFAAVSALGTVVLAYVAWRQLPLIVKQVEALSEQIKLSREAEDNAERRLREWETLKACRAYELDPVLDEATKRIWQASDNGQNYRSPNIDTRDVIILLNYLDGLATGIEQKLYIEEVVRDHMGQDFRKAVECFIETGIVDRDGMAALLAVHARWFRPAPPTGYQSRTASH